MSGSAIKGRFPKLCRGYHPTPSINKKQSLCKNRLLAWICLFRGMREIMKSLRFAIPVAFVAAFVATVATTAQQPGPIPPALHTAQTVFVSNAGSDSGLFPEPFSGDTNRPYSQFFNSLKATGAFELVADPAQADLVLEIQLTAPTGPQRGSKQLGAGDPVPMFRLVVYDRKSHYILWTETQSIDIAFLQKTHDRNFDDALNAVVNRFLQVAGKNLSSPKASR
jgi:hypothetical protein